MALADIEILQRFEPWTDAWEDISYGRRRIRKWIEWTCIPEMDGMGEGLIKVRIPQVRANKQVIRMTRTGMATLKPKMQRSQN